MDKGFRSMTDSAIKSFGGLARPAVDVDGSPLLPCGHSARQAQWLGCTELECRPLDNRISESYAEFKANQRE